MAKISSFESFCCLRNEKKIYSEDKINMKRHLYLEVLLDLQI